MTEPETQEDIVEQIETHIQKIYDLVNADIRKEFPDVPDDLTNMGIETSTYLAIVDIMIGFVDFSREQYLEAVDKIPKEHIE